ncbi:unnamed protein product [Symbiodinium natans]|uniref:Uncharacterized protein n=1 Tax=Symbiodinium natans TaxID=878477 RepID=A0A812I912_9DINO|nr:unnamed protein product [Symbiodinium natans]
MYLFHRLLSLLTMMYNEHDQLTLCDFVRPKQRRQIQRDRSARGDGEEEGEASPRSPAETPKAKPKAKVQPKPKAG